jgi:hypothetical protein
MTPFELYAVIGLTCAVFETYWLYLGLVKGEIDPSLNDAARQRASDSLTTIHSSKSALPPVVFGATLLIGLFAVGIAVTYVWPYFAYRGVKNRIGG